MSIFLRLLCVTILITGLVTISPSMTHAQESLISSDEDQSSGNSLPDTAEYYTIPEGMLLEQNGQNDENNADTEYLTNYLAQIPDYYNIPTVGGDDSFVSATSTLTMKQIKREYKKANYDIVLKNLRPMAENNQHEASQMLGIMYMQGQGVEKDEEEAKRYLTKAADNNYPIAQHYLGIMLFQGGPTWKPNIIIAMKWLRLASLKYADGPEKKRARQDYLNVFDQATRLEKSRALDAIRGHLIQYDELHLLEEDKL